MDNITIMINTLAQQREARILEWCTINQAEIKKACVYSVIAEDMCIIGGIKIKPLAPCSKTVYLYESYQLYSKYC